MGKRGEYRPPNANSFVVKQEVLALFDDPSIAWPRNAHWWHYVEEDEIRRFDPEMTSFFNVNRPQDLSRLQGMQQRFLAALAPLVKKGGWLVYCVCSPEPEEGQNVVEDFLKRYSDFVICHSSTKLPGIDNRFISKSGVFRTLPHKHGTDGFFAVRLRRVTL